jgi:NADPH:quinone reductase
MRAVQIEEFGGPEVLQVVDLPEPEPGDGEVLIEVTRSGMNFADTHQRENSYLARYEVPLVLGGEVAGTTSDGRRVVALLASGGYAEYAVAPEATVFPIPDGLDDGAALALLTRGSRRGTCSAPPRSSPQASRSWWCRERAGWGRWRCSSRGRSARAA